MTATTLVLGQIILPDRIVRDGALLCRDGRIFAVGTASQIGRGGKWTVVTHSGYVAPGFIDLHVHGGNGADFMDASVESFRTVVAAHLRHGTTTIVPTTTVAKHETLMEVLRIARGEMAGNTNKARIAGVHFYGPYFGRQAAGCHPADTLRDPDPKQYHEYLDYADILVSATVAPELPGAEGFARACHARNITVNVGHSHCTFVEMQQAITWGARHVDHLYCAMSDRARLRLSQTYPMRGGVFEATLYFDELTTEVIADGRHLSPELLLLAYKIKGPDRLALVTDCNRGMDLPDGRYVFGPLSEGQEILKNDGVGLMLDGQALASSVQGMDHMVRTFHAQTGVPLPEVIRMASLTPARIIGKDHQIGSLEVGKAADLVFLDSDLAVTRVWVGGVEVFRGT